LVTRLADIFTRKPTLAVDATPLAQARQPERQQRLAEAVRTALVIRAAALNGAGAQVAEVATSPLVEIGTTLWTRVLRFDAADPAWADRDRVILARREHAALARTILNLTGNEGTDLGLGLPGLDPVFAPPGQALAFAVGQALAGRG
jgi:transketolase